jgi:hypothetical protein
MRKATVSYSSNALQPASRRGTRYLPVLPAQRQVDWTLADKLLPK